MWIEKQIYFENHYHQKDIYLENNLNHVLPVLLFYLVLLLIMLLLLLFLILLSKPELFMSPEISDSLTNFFLLSLHQAYYS